MKISSASKKVLVSALSAAMVVAFAPTAAFAVGTTTNTGDWREADWIAAGAIAKTTTYGTTITENYYFSADELNDALGTNSQAVNGTVKLLKDVEVAGNLSVYVTNSKTLTLDLNGHTLSTEASEDEGVNDLISSVSGNFIVKNGTLNAANSKNDGVVTVKKAVAGAASYEDVTADEVAGVTEAKGTVKLGDVVSGGLIAAKKAVVETGSITGDVTVGEGASLTATATSKAALNAIGGSLTVQKNGSATVSATTSNGDAVAVYGGVDADQQGATVTATAKAAGDTGDAVAVRGHGEDVAFTTLNATADSNGAAAYGIKATGKKATVKGGKVVANGATAKVSYAVQADDVDITGGTYEGILNVTNKKVTTAGSETSPIKAGTFTANPVDYVNTNLYDVAKDGDLYTVAQFKGFTNTGVDATAGVTADLSAYLQDALTEMAKGNSVEGLTLAEGVKAEDILAQAKKTAGSDAVKIKVSFKQYVEKNATDAQKAAKKAIEDAAKADLSATDPAMFFNVSCEIYYTPKNSVDKKVLATVTSLGKKTVGLSSVDATAKFNFKDAGFLASDATCKDLTAWSAGAAASKAAFTDTDNDGKPNPEGNTVELATLPTMLALTSVDQEAIKNAAAGKADQPATEKATQGIDVDQKSKTVKLAKKAKKTKKAASFNLGATAQTGLTIAKASGSSKVTVSSTGKVTLKKGAKKGTYKAKVTINAAASDAYLAAAKTVTVTFKVAK